MAWKEGISYLPGTWRIAAAGKRGQGVKISGANQVSLTGANDHPDGILVDDHKANELVRAVALQGGQVAEVKLAGAVAAGAEVACGAGGDFVTAAAGTKQTVIGRVDKAYLDNDLAQVFINPYRNHA